MRAGGARCGGGAPAVSPCDAQYDTAHHAANIHAQRAERYHGGAPEDPERPVRSVEAAGFPRVDHLAEVFADWILGT